MHSFVKDADDLLANSVPIIEMELMRWGICVLLNIRARVRTHQTDGEVLPCFPSPLLIIILVN